MTKPTIHAALELGSSQICLAIGEVTDDNRLKLLSVAETPSEGISKGCVTEPKKASDALHKLLLKVEDQYDLDLHRVYLSISGAKIRGGNYRGTRTLPDNDKQITTGHLDFVENAALDAANKKDRINLLHTIHHYELDGKIHQRPPLNLTGKKLSVDYHCIHGSRKHIEANVQCVRSIRLEIESIVFSPVAASLAMLDRELLKAGALVIDMGAGTTDYVLYSDGSIAASGSVPLGGYDITHEICRTTGLPIDLAEQLKIKAGNAGLNPDRDVEAEHECLFPYLDIDTAQVYGSEPFSSTQLRYKIINRIIRLTQQNILSRIHECLPSDITNHSECQVYLTGGGCQQKGLATLACDTFGIPVNFLGPKNCPRCDDKFWRPKYSTVIGLLHNVPICYPRETD